MTTIHLKTTNSTNSYLSDLVRQKGLLPSGSVVYADYQTAGRGQQNNKWEAEEGKNLLFSMLIVPQGIKATEQFYVSEAVALGICEFLADKASGFSVKWPNDIYWNDKKIAGILIENVLNGTNIAYSIAGVGLNINQRIFVSDAPNPISLANICNKEFDLEQSLRQIRANIMSNIELAQNDKDFLHNKYKSNLWRFGTDAEYCDKDGKFIGKITDVAPSGQISIQKSDGTTGRYMFKEVGYR